MVETNLSDLRSATRIMKAVRSRIRKEINTLRPPYRYVVVNSINAADNTILVHYPETPDSVFKVSAGTSLPLKAGQKVRIAGFTGDRYVDDVPNGQVAMMPTGAIQMYGGTVAPPGWLVCGGQVYDPDTYKALYSVIGTIYGGSSGAPLLPNFSARFPRGNTPNDNGGSVTHSHDVSEAQALVQFGSSAAHIRQTGSLTGWTATDTFDVTGASSSYSPPTAAELYGDTSAESHLPPYVGVKFIIKF